MKSLPRIQTNNSDVRRIQDLIVRWTNQLLGISILNGILLENVVLTSGSNEIEHKLDRVPKGWVVVDQNASATFYSSSKTNRVLTLVASANATVSIWVF
jgi:hypothetical protein